MANIVRIIAVCDTREREEIGERFVPIPGSGSIRSCDRCNRDHEIHVEVELSDGRTTVVGQGCAKSESMEMQGKIKSAISAAKTYARLAAELASARVALNSAEDAWAVVQAMPLPGEPVPTKQIPDDYGRAPTLVYELADARVWCRGGLLDEERRRALVNDWRQRRYREAGQDRDPWSHRNTVVDLEMRLARAERRMRDVTSQPVNV